jgi:c-di-GMP-binding flagellar brake protein YcgR
MNLDHVLKTGTLVELHYDETIKMNTLVDQPYSYGVFTIYAPIQNGAPIQIAVGETVSIVFSTRNPETMNQDFYKIACTITEKKHVDQISVYQLSVVGEPERAQRRGAFRVDILKQALAGNVDSEGVEEWWVITIVNISVSGLKATSTKRAAPGSTILLKLDLDTEILDIRANVIGCDINTDLKSQYILKLEFLISHYTVDQKISAYLLRKQSEQLQKNQKDDDTLLDIEAMLKGKTWVHYLFIVANVILVILMVATYSELSSAAPRSNLKVFETLLGIKMNTPVWDYQRLHIAGTLNQISLIVNIVGLITKTLLKSLKKFRLDFFFAIMLVVNLIIWFYIKSA